MSQLLKLCPSISKVCKIITKQYYGLVLPLNLSRGPCKIMCFISLIVIDIVNVLISTNVCFMYVYVYMSYVYARYHHVYVCVCMYTWVYVCICMYIYITSLSLNDMRVVFYCCTLFLYIFEYVYLA